MQETIFIYLIHYNKNYIFFKLLFFLSLSQASPSYLPRPLPVHYSFLLSTFYFFLSLYFVNIFFSFLAILFLIFHLSYLFAVLFLAKYYLFLYLSLFLGFLFDLSNSISFFFCIPIFCNLKIDIVSYSSFFLFSLYRSAFSYFFSRKVQTNQLHSRNTNGQAGSC